MAEATRAPVSARFHPLTVAHIARETRDSVVLTLTVPDAARAAFRYTQGQYLTFRAMLDGIEERRSYSICSGVGDPHLRVGIKKVAGGLFSTYANEALKVGDTLDAMAPMGHFFVPLDPAARRHVVAFAAGSGITPILGILRTMLAAEPHSRFTLVYGNRASSSIMFRDEIEDLKSLHMARLSVIHVLSREQQDVELFNGRLTREKCDGLLDRWIGAGSIDTAFICGPQEMMLDVSESLASRGVDRARIKFELFATAARSVARPIPAETSASTEACETTIVIDGHARSFTMPKGRISVLEAGMAQGIELPYACKGGVCSTCRAMVLEGQVDMDANFALEDYEIARGYVLTCQSFAASDRLVIDYDK